MKIPGLRDKPGKKEINEDRREAEQRKKKAQREGQVSKRNICAHNCLP